MAAISTTNNIRIYNCTDWDAFLREARITRYTTDGSGSHHIPRIVMFRGHAELGWHLSSTLERALSLPPQNVTIDGRVFDKPHLRMIAGDNWYSNECQHILERFTKNASGLPTFKEDAPEISKWLIGRHYGLHSPYLDWTASPFVAAFFALEKVYNNFSGLRTYYPMHYTVAFMFGDCASGMILLNPAYSMSSRHLRSTERGRERSRAYLHAFRANITLI